MAHEAETKVIYIPSHADLAVSELLFINRLKPRITALARAIGTAVQLLEDVAFDFIVSFRLDGVSGANLDLFGQIVGEQRQGLSDADYRRFIEARIKANLSEGTRDELIEIWQLIMNADAVKYTDHFPAAFSLAALRTSFVDDTLKDRAKLFMLDIKPAGVAMDLYEVVTPAWTYDDGPAYDEGQYARRL